MSINATTIGNRKNTSFFHFFADAYQLCNTWINRQKTRRQLAQLPAYLLRDIGLTEADRYQESRKHFWED
ncbi:DUF1127 domain-containing protein [Agarivorans gilvus]|uniref:YjiS-like domain-containing protein n=1 Tax=Agarivorans gilvus TaxID=680279 RepID=A0ABQ1I8S4_9ALTE|nr:DUF1127 domain-containing protein [Agarivorans gilvus]GGB19816.1 hypothetical protein GCM10007414_36540 [Agarivorans gilvus]